MEKAKIGVFNYREASTSRVIYVEPWGEDFTLLPGDDLEVVAGSENDECPWFNIVESDGATQIYCEATSSFLVLQNGEPIHCGHRRGE